MNNEKDNGIFFSTQEILTEEIILYVHIVNKVTVKNSVITDLDLREICSRTIYWETGECRKKSRNSKTICLK